MPRRDEPRTLGALLRMRRDTIVAEWESAARRMLDARHMPGPLLRDSIPVLVDRIAAVVERGERHSVDEPSELHAAARLDRGFDLDEAVAEYALLRTCIIERLREEQVPIAHDQLLALNQAIDDATLRLIARFTAVRQRALYALQEIAGATVSDAVEVDALLRRLVTVFRSSTPAADSVAILAREGERLRVRASVGIDGLTPGLALPIAEGFAGVVVSKGATTAQCDSGVVSDDPLIAPGTRCVHGVPLQVEGELLGVATMGSLTAKQLSSEDMLALRMVAVRASDVIAYQYAVIRERASHAAARAFGSSDTLYGGIARLLELMGTDLGWDVAAYWELDASRDVLVHRLVWSGPSLPRSAFVRASERTLLARGEGLPGRTLASGRPVWIADVTTDPRFPRRDAAASDGLRTGVAFPLMAGEQPLGVIELFSRTSRTPSEEALQLTAAISAHASELVRRVVAQEAVQRSEAFNAAVLQSALDCVVAMDADGVVTAWNPAAERTFGYSREEAIGKTVAEIIVPPELREAHRAGLARYLATGHGPLMDRRIEIEGLRKDGTRIPVELTITRVPLPGPPLFTAYLRDLTERVAAERTRERFVGILGHDLRNPLGAIQLGVQILGESEQDPKQAAIVRRIGSSAARMARMVQELLDFTRGRMGGGIPVTRRPADLAAIASSVIEEVRLAHPDRAIELSIAGDTRGAWDAERLMQVLSNLLGNAMQHGAAGEPARVLVDGAGAELVLRVSNRADCPSPELLARLFDPFRRGELETGGEQREGLGLGLYITREIVLAHRGTIDARCDEAAGFTVTVVLPRSAEA